jgi:hypothetical protein
MSIDLVVTSLSEDWANYSDESLELLASLDHLAVHGEARGPYDRDPAERAFCGAPPADQRARASVARAVRRFQEALSARFERTISWSDEAGLEEHLGQLDPRAALALHEILSEADDARFPNLLVMDITNVYVPVELPAVLTGQPRSIGSVPALRREIEQARELVGDDDGLIEHLDLLEEACELAMRSNAVVLVSG